MQQTAIQSQIEAIKKATQIASKSKEAALKFLVDAGIVRQDSPKETITTAKTPK
jgi:hypothetical protein